jgi:hypothetical protein
MKPIHLLKNLLIFTVILCAASLSATHADSHKFGMAGCGLGSMALPGKNGKEQIVAATLNATGVQTFGITTGTSNCVDDSATASLSYISVNQMALKKDAARGEGESIDGLGKVLKCSNSLELGQTLQSHYSEIFGVEKFDSKIARDQIQSAIQNTPALQATCLSAK